MRLHQQSWIQKRKPTHLGPCSTDKRHSLTSVEMKREIRIWTSCHPDLESQTELWFPADPFQQSCWLKRFCEFLSSLPADLTLPDPPAAEWAAHFSSRAPVCNTTQTTHFHSSGSACSFGIRCVILTTQKHMAGGCRALPVSCSLRSAETSSSLFIEETSKTCKTVALEDQDTLILTHV